MLKRTLGAVFGVTLLVGTFGLLTPTLSGAVAHGGHTTLTAHAAKKTITCYKGSASKKVTAAKPVCPKGWSTKKPAAKSETISAHYSGSLSLLWSASNVTASLTGAGTGTTLGLTSVSGTGSSVASSSSDPLVGTGKLSGTTGTLSLRFISPSMATAADSSAPTTVTVAAKATITGGTGSFAGASGTLTITGSFSIQSTTAGSSEKDSYTATVTGTIKL